MALISTLIASTILGSASAPAFPTYNFKEGDTWTYQVKAKADIQPYAIGGKLTMKFISAPTMPLAINVEHATVMEVGNEKADGGTTSAIYGVDKMLAPTNSGQGAMLFAPQFLSAIFLPANNGGNMVFLGLMTEFRSGLMTEFRSTTSEDKDLVKITSSAKTQVESTSIEQWVDPKAGRLVRAKVVTTNATGKITYELLPVE